MATNTSGFSGTSQTILSIGVGKNSSVNRTINIIPGVSSGIRWNGTDSTWELSNDGGSTWYPLATSQDITRFVFIVDAESAAGEDNDLCFVVQTETYYRYESNAGIYTDDNMTVLSTGDGGNTRWLAVAGKYANANIDGLYSTYLGYDAVGNFNAAASRRIVGIGESAARNVSTATDVTAVGYRSRYIGASYCVAIGSEAMYQMSTTGDHNIAIGYRAMLGGIASQVGSSTRNIAIGSLVMPVIETSNDNIGIGYNALNDLTTGDNNIILGYNAGDNITTGGNNIGIGTNSLTAVTTNSGNVCVGSDSGYRIIGTENICIGNSSGIGLVSDDSNIAIGKDTLYTNSGTKTYCTAIGESAGKALDTSNNAIMIGKEAADISAGGIGKIVIGYRAGRFATTDYFVAIGYQATQGGLTFVPPDVAIGYQAAYSGGAQDSIAIGYQSLYSGQEIQDCIAIGKQALYSTTGLIGVGRYSVAIGNYALYHLSNGTKNIAVGYNAGHAMTNANGSVSIGYRAGSAQQTNDDQIAIGQDCLLLATGIKNLAIGGFCAPALTTGTSNTVIGYKSLYSATTAGKNTALGYETLYQHFQTPTSDGNVAVGYQVLRNGISEYATFIGYQAGYGGGGANHDYNIGVGYQTLYSVDSGANNIAIGRIAGSNLESGAYNIFIGDNAGSSSTISSYNICFGPDADIDDGYNEQIAIGHNAATAEENAIAIGDGASANAKDSIAIGRGATASVAETMMVGAGGGPTIDCYANSWNPYSDERFKKDIKTLTEKEGINLVLSLRPVEYKWKNPSENNYHQHNVRYGFIAQEVKQSLENIEIYSHGMIFDEEPRWALDYNQIVAPLVKSVQFLHDKLVKTETLVSDLKKQIEELKNGK